jgi:hypothetical protein
MHCCTDAVAVVELLYRERHEFYSNTDYHDDRAGTYTHDRAGGAEAHGL